MQITPSLCLETKDSGAFLDVAIEGPPGSVSETLRHGIPRLHRGQSGLLMVQWLDSALLLQGAWVQSLLGEAGSWMPLGERGQSVAILF